MDLSHIVADNANTSPVVDLLEMFESAAQSDQHIRVLFALVIPVIGELNALEQRV